MGRPRKPTRLHLINGNPGKRPLPAAEPQPEGDLLQPPGWLSQSQKEGWAYAIEHAPRGLLKRLDSSLLVIWVIAEDIHRQAAMKVAEHGMLIRAPNTGEPMQSPYMPIMNKQSTIMLRAVSALGFSPTSRPTITMPPSVNPFSNNGLPVA